MLYVLRYCPLIYTILAAWLYSNQQVFENTVLANKSHSRYNAESGHDMNQMYSQINPGSLFYAVNWLFFLYLIYLVIVYVLQRNLPKLFDSCPRFGCRLTTTSETAKFDKIVLKRKVTFYQALSDR